MLDKLKSLLQSGLEKLPDIVSSKATLRVILGITLVFILITLMFFSGWVYIWYSTGKPDLPVLISFLKEITGPAGIAFITFIGKGFIDNDNDGTPDIFETGTISTQQNVDIHVRSINNGQ